MQGAIYCFDKSFVCLSIGRVNQIFVFSLGRSCGGVFRYPVFRNVHGVHVPISWLKSLRQHMWIFLGATLVVPTLLAVPESWTLFQKFALSPSWNNVRCLDTELCMSDGVVNVIL